MIFSLKNVSSIPGISHWHLINIINAFKSSRNIEYVHYVVKPLLATLYKQLCRALKQYPIISLILHRAHNSDASKCK